jgi:hypothetical protein
LDALRDGTLLEATTVTLYRLLIGYFHHHRRWR